MPKVSIIIPSYNHARFLEQRLDSILNQTYQDFEIIFLDDASSDTTKAIFTKYCDHPKLKKAIFNSQNSGSPFRQWNKGVKEAEGEYIWIAESDDYAELNFLETLVPILEKNDKLGIAYCQSNIVNKKGKKIGSYADWTKKLDEDRWEKNFVNQGKNEVENYLIWQNTIPNASAVLFRKTAYIDSGMAPEDMRMLGDWQVYLSILNQYDISFISVPLNYNRFHPKVSRVVDTTEKKFRRYVEQYSILEFLFTHFDINQETSQKASFNLLKQWVNLLSLSDFMGSDSIPFIKCYWHTDKWKYKHIPYLIIELIKSDLKKLKNQIINYLKKARNKWLVNKSHQTKPM